MTEMLCVLFAVNCFAHGWTFTGFLLMWVMVKGKF